MEDQPLIDLVSREHPPAGMRVMQILTRMNVGGITHQVLMLCEQLRQQGYDVRLATGQSGSREGDCRTDAVGRGFRVDSVPHLSNEAGVIGNLLALWGLYWLLRRERPALVHLYMFKARILGSIAARLAGIPVVIETLHGNVLEGYYGKVATAIILLAERMTGRVLVDRVIAPSEGQRAELMGYRVAKGGKILVHPVGFNAGPFEAVDKFHGQLRKALAARLDTKVVGMMTRLVPIKGVGDFLEAAALLAKTLRHDEMTFVVAGDGPLRVELEHRAKALNLDGRCRFLGRVDDVRSFYADADVVVLSSLNEGTPIALLEAMACGKAIVATKVGGVPEMLTDGVSALLVPSRNPQALAKAIERVALDADMRARLGREARRRSLEFSASTLGQLTHEVYRKMLEGEDRPFMFGAR